MILVKVELHNANTGAVTELGRAMIYNDGTGDHMYGNYQVIVQNQDERAEQLPRITDWPRQIGNFWKLVGRALAPIF